MEEPTKTGGENGVTETGDGEPPAPGGRPKKARLRTRVLAVLGSVLLSLVLLEAGVRIFLPDPMFHVIDINAFGAHYRLSANPRLIYVPTPGAGDQNSYGHRGPAFPFARTGRKRVIFMGDSVVEGYGLPVADRFTDLAAQRLGDKWECVNLGVRGYDFSQEVEYLKALGLKFAPDAVFWCITGNDLALWPGEAEKLVEILKSRKHNEFYADYYSLKGSLTGLLLKSRFYRTVRYFLAGRAGADRYQKIQYRTTPGELTGMVNEVKKLAARNNFKVVFIMLPVNTREYASDMALFRKTLSAASVPYLDVDAYVRANVPAERQADLFLPKDPCHLSPAGHRLMSDVILAILSKIYPV